MTSVTSLLQALRARGPLTPRELRDALQVSQSTISRLLRPQIGVQVLELGRTRRARYAALRSVDGLGTSAPLLRVDGQGAVVKAGTLHFLFEDGTAYERPDGTSSVHGALPWFLEDARPQGFLGRSFATTHADLQLPPLLRWQPNHVLRALALRGEDLAGDLILGNASAERFFLGASAPATPVPERSRRNTYPKLAQAALAGADPGSSAGGEQPKFTARVSGRSGARAVIVKFSPPTGSDVGRRWADLLICEHLAHEVLRAHGLPASQSALLEGGDRVFLEVTRFDRVGDLGRRPLASLFAIDAEFIGGAQTWSEGAARLLKAGQLGAAEAATVMRFEAFGRLIQNSDRHLGNLSFFWEEPRPGAPTFTLAPLYDMLPMAFRPQADQVIERAPSPAIPDVHLLPYWEELRGVAKAYWSRVQADPRISRRFKAGPAAAASKAMG